MGGSPPSADLHTLPDDLSCPHGQPRKRISAMHAVYWSILLLLAVAMGVTWFSGIEAHPLYSGAVIQALEPGSFSSDEFMSPTRPIMTSLQYKLLVPLFGRRWLDDRFVCLLNCLVALGSFWGLDRILEAFGMSLSVHRLILLTVFCVGHGLINNIASIVNHNEFNPTSLSRPLSIWMVYFAIADRKPWKWVLMGTIVAGMSVKNAWSP